MSFKEEPKEKKLLLTIQFMEQKIDFLLNRVKILVIHVKKIKLKWIFEDKHNNIHVIS